MATTPVTPTPALIPGIAAVYPTPATTQADLTAALSSLAHKHVTVTYSVIAVLVVVLALASVGGYLALRFADAQLARAETMEAKYDADRKTWQDQLTANTKERTQLAGQQQVIVKVVHDRDTTAAAAIAVAQAPKPLTDVESGLRRAYKDAAPFDTPLPLDGVYIELTAQQGSAVTAQKIAGDRDAADLADTQNVLKLEQTKTGTLTTDLSGCVSTLSEADKSIALYKKAAKRSRFRKFLGGVEKVAILVGGIYLGHKL